MNRASSLSIILLVGICWSFAPAISSADDFAPPPWSRLHPGAITAEWEFFTPANPALADGPLTNVYTKGTGSVVTTATIFGPSGWGGTSGGNWFFPPSTAPQGMRFTVDNIIDHEPVKHLRVQVTSTPDMVMFLDPMAAFNLTAVGSGSGPVSSTTTLATSPFGPVAHTLFTWDMFPNPPWETFTLNVLSPGEIRQVVVDTISTGIPEPTTFVVYGLALLLAGVAYLKRPQGWKL